MQDVTVDTKKMIEARIKWLSVEEWEHEMAFAIALYESRQRLQGYLREALSCGKSRAKKVKLYARWKQELEPELVTELVGVLRNKQALEIIMGWKLVDPRH